MNKNICVALIISSLLAYAPKVKADLVDDIKTTVVSVAVCAVSGYLSYKLVLNLFDPKQKFYSALKMYEKILTDPVVKLATGPDGELGSYIVSLEQNSKWPLLDVDSHLINSVAALEDALDATQKAQERLSNNPDVLEKIKELITKIIDLKNVLQDKSEQISREEDYNWQFKRFILFKTIDLERRFNAVEQGSQEVLNDLSALVPIAAATIAG